MATELILKLHQENDIISYDFDIDGEHVRFNIVSFSGIKEYNSYTKSDDEKIFSPLDNKEINSIVGYDWGFVDNIEGRGAHVYSGTPKRNVNIFNLMKVIEYIGKDYVMVNWPDVIFYEADSHRLGKIYARMFPSFGYVLSYIVGKYYVFTCESKDKSKKLANFGEKL